MGWKGAVRGAVRSLQATARREERESRRRHNALQREHKQLEKMLEQGRSAHEVALYNNRVDLLRSVQKECSPVWDWPRIKATPPPTEPNRGRANEMAAQMRLQNFQPNLIHRLFRRVESKRQSLTLAVDAALQADESAYQQALREYQRQHAEWQESRELADRILRGDLKAYLEVINEVSPLKEISELGSTLEIRFQHRSSIEVTLHVNGGMTLFLPKSKLNFKAASSL